MKMGPAIDWEELAILCAKFNSEDNVFDSADIQKSRQKEFQNHREVVEARLNQIAENGRFEGWLALYQPALPGVQRVQPIITREEAAPHRERCEELIALAMDYAQQEMEMHAHWNEALSRKLAYEVTHPDVWEKVKVGTALQALLKCQREFLVEVMPNWYIQHGGDMRTHHGLSFEQMLQAGRTAPEAADDWLGPNLGGLLDDLDGGYDLGIDPQFG